MFETHTVEIETVSGVSPEAIRRNIESIVGVNDVTVHSDTHAEDDTEVTTVEMSDPFEEGELRYRFETGVIGDGGFGATVELVSFEATADLSENFDLTLEGTFD